MRYGAALCFNKLYRDFREEKALVERFTFDIIKHLIASLKLAHYDDVSLQTIGV